MRVATCTCALLASVLVSGIALGGVMPPPEQGAIANIGKEPCPGGGGDIIAPRACAPSSRSYVPRYRTLGHELLELESTECAVPDSAFARLDDIIDRVRGAAQGVGLGGKLSAADAEHLSRLIGETLEKLGYTIEVRFDQLGDALTPSPTTGKFVMDCDTGSAIYVSVADALGLRANFGEIPTGGGWWHYYVVWELDGGGTFRWDTNERASRGPSAVERLLPRAGIVGQFINSRAQALASRGDVGRAVADLYAALSLDSGDRVSSNNLAWLLSTNRAVQGWYPSSEAVRLATQAVAVQRTGSHLDTLACALAAAGDWERAIEAERESVEAERSRSTECRLGRIKAHMDCVGDH